MTHHPGSANPQIPSLQKFLEIYEKMLKDTRAFAAKMDSSIKREVSKNSR